MSEFYAHTAPGDTLDWEPLFTTDCLALTDRECERCERLEPRHGHLNKVAWWTARFTEKLFPYGSPESAAARHWGYVAGLWHDLGKFAPAWQSYLRSKADIHSDEVASRMDHATAGAQHAFTSGNIVGHLLAYSIAGHHSGLLDAFPRTPVCRSDSTKTSLISRMRLAKFWSARSRQCRHRLLVTFETRWSQPFARA